MNEDDLLEEVRKNWNNRIDKEIDDFFYGGTPTDAKVTGLLNLIDDTK